MRYIIGLVSIIIIGICSCKNGIKMTNKEKELINNTSEGLPFYILQITNEEDSLVLRCKSKDIDPTTIRTDEDLKTLIERMKISLAQEQAVGLAAPQIGISRNLFLFMRIDQPEEYPVQVAINPRIINHPDNTICFEGDGCLSIPNESGTSIRYPWIDVEYYNENGDLIKEHLTGDNRESDFTGIIFQHEFDHLQGVLFTDKLCEEEGTKNE